MIIVLVHAAAAERDLITDSGDVLTYMAGVTRGRYCSKCYILSASWHHTARGIECVGSGDCLCLSGKRIMPGMAPVAWALLADRLHTWHRLYKTNDWNTVLASWLSWAEVGS